MSETPIASLANRFFLHFVETTSRLLSLQKVPSKVPNKLKLNFPDLSDAVWCVYLKIKEKPHAYADELGMALNITGRMVRKHIATLREAGLIERE